MFAIRQIALITLGRRLTALVVTSREGLTAADQVWLTMPVITCRTRKWAALYRKATAIRLRISFTRIQPSR